MPSPRIIDLPTADESSQLEDMQTLLEISHANESKAQQLLTEIKKALEQALLNHKEEQLNNRELKMAVEDAQACLEITEKAHEQQLNEVYIQLENQRYKYSSLEKIVIKLHHENAQLKASLAEQIAQNRQAYARNTNAPFWREPLTGQQIQERVAYNPNKTGR